MIRLFLAGLFSLIFCSAALAQERITNFDVIIDVDKTGDIVVTETIKIQDNPGQRRRGIYRDLPRYAIDKDGDKLETPYSIMSITRDGQKERFEKSTDGNALKIRIGDANIYLPTGEHVYSIQYKVGNQIRRFDQFDELYWNVTGHYWNYPIETATATIRFPNGTRLTDQSAYTGYLNSKSQNYTFNQNSNSAQFKTTDTLAAGQGLTISASVPKGIINPLSRDAKNKLWLQKNASLLVLLTSMIGMFGYYLRNWSRVGRDPVKGPVFPRYEPPKGYSPAAVSRIHFKGFRGHKALTAALMSLATQGKLDINSEKKTTILSAKDMSMSGISREDTLLFENLFKRENTVTLGKKYNARFTSAYNKFKKQGDGDFGKAYYRRNVGYTVLGIVISFIVVIIGINLATQWKPIYTGLILGLAALNLLFMFLMPAPSIKGQEVMTEIEGFKLYLETAEKLRLNAYEVGSEKPPAMTVERYEAFMPYAVGLGVEKPWTKHFEAVMPVEAKEYNPGWTNMRAGDYGSLNGMNKALTSNMNSGVSRSLPQSSSSSGSGGGGFSGGGGGGGGGGSW